MKEQEYKEAVINSGVKISPPIISDPVIPDEEKVKRAILDAIPDMIFRISRDGVFRSFEGDTEELYKDEKTYLGSNIYEVMPLETADIIMHHIQQAFETGDMVYYEYMLPLGGSPQYYEARMMQSMDDEVLAIVRNITRRKKIENELNEYHDNLENIIRQRTEDLREREALYSAILEGYEGFIYIVSKEFKIRFMNENLIRSTGKNAIGKTCYQAIHNREKVCPWCAAEQVFKGQSVRFEMKNPSDKKWYYSINTPIYHADNNISYQAMIVDIDDRKQMEEALRESEEFFRKENVRLRSTIKERYKFGNIVGRSEKMQEVYELILNAAASDAHVIINGESGTGKELVSRAIHDLSDRRDKKFVPVNCGAIPENLLESEFFGHRKGAFTGATANKPGYLDEADQGTLFLDEIGEISLNMQVKLLRAIEGGGFTPVGGSELKKTDFRIIAATNRNLSELVKNGLMREDFYYRIHVIPILLPPLRDRKEDISLLIDHFLRPYQGKKLPVLSTRILESLMQYDWPGNVRELQNVIHRFITLKKIDFLGISGPGTSLAHNSEDAVIDTDKGLHDAVKEFESRFLQNALKSHNGNRTYAARALGIGLRTLQRKIKEYQIQ